MEREAKAFFTTAVLMDLAKAFDCLPHDLVIAKLNTCGFDRKSLVFFYSYLKQRKQCINDIHREKFVLYLIQYKNSLKHKVDCF